MDSRPPSDLQRPAVLRWGLRALAVVAVVLFLGMVGRFWHPIYGFTAFLQLDTRHEAVAIAAFHKYPVFVYRDPGGYDGLQYAQIAYHPLLTTAELRPAIDNLPYRGRRILLPVLAWLLAAGQPAWIAQVYCGLNIACWLILAALLWRMLPVNDARSLIAWTGILFSAGVLGSVRFALIDLPALTLVAAALWAAERGRPRTAVGWLAAAALTRETSLLTGAAFVTGPWKSPRAVGRNLLWIMLAAVPLIAWIGYISWCIAPVNQGARNFAWPLVGFVEKLNEGVVDLIQSGLPVNQYALTTLLAMIGLTVQAGFILLRPRPADLWWRVGAAYTLLMLVLGPAVWEGFPIAASRVLLPLSLACNVLALRTRAPVALLLACNLTVFSGLLSVRYGLSDYNLLTMARHQEVSGTIHLGKGWYGGERNSRHRWAWAESEGHLAIATWPRSEAVETRLTLRLICLIPQTVRILAAGREIWSGPIGKTLTVVSLPPLPVTGEMDLELATDGPPVPESASPDARRLGFALYDPAISVSERPSAPP
jgi:hypothetical protein